MSRVRGLLERIAKLERNQGGGPTIFDHWYGSFDAFEAESHEQTNLCQTDWPVVLSVLRTWHTTGVKLGRGRRGE